MGFGIYAPVLLIGRWSPSQGGDGSSNLLGSTIRARGGMVDTPVLGTGPFGGVGSSPTGPTTG